MPALIVALEIIGAVFAANVVVEALVINVELAGDVLRVAVMEISHIEEGA